MAPPPVPTSSPLPAGTPGSKSVRPSGRVSLLEAIGLGCGRITADGSLGTIHLLASPIYNMTLGVSPVLISTAVFIQRIWDAMLDPLCGQFSDNFRSRWGRRRPLMLASAPVLALFFALLWWFPRGASEHHLFAHFVGVSLLFFVAQAIFAMALGGLILEATDEYHERTRIAGITLAAGFAFLVASQWFFPATQLPIFSDTISGVRWVATGCAVAFLAFGLVPVMLCREKHYARLVARQPRVSFWSSLRAVRDTRPFLLLVTARFAATFGYNLVGVMFLYMNNYYVFGGDLRKAAFALGVIGSSFQVAGILSSLFVYPWLTRRLGKQRVFQLSAVILMAGCVAKLFVYQPGQPWWQFVVLIANGTSSAGMVMMANAMLGDIADYDEWRTGLRREALFMAVWNWFEKAGNSLGSLVTGFVLVAIGFDAKLGAQSPHTLLLMKWCYFAAPFTGAVIALLFIRRYDLDEEKVTAIRVDLDARHAV